MIIIYLPYVNAQFKNCDDRFNCSSGLITRFMLVFCFEAGMLKTNNEKNLNKGLFSLYTKNNSSSQFPNCHENSTPEVERWKNRSGLFRFWRCLFSVQ